MIHICLCYRFKKSVSGCLEVSLRTLTNAPQMDGSPALLQGQRDAGAVTLTETHCGMSEPTEMFLLCIIYDFPAFI